MKTRYDYIYLTNTPSFYKINLCNALGANGLKGLIVFYGYGSEAVNTDLSERKGLNPLLDTVFLNSGSTSRRSRIVTWRALRRLMSRVDSPTVIFSGWLAAEYNLYSFFSPRRRNVVVVESTPMDSATSGLKGLVKRLIASRMSRALPAGSLHATLLERLHFKGKMKETGSVGLFDRASRPALPHIMPDDGVMRSLFVGRLTDVKNLEWLIERFNRSGHPLTIVGSGEAQSRLQAMAAENITFRGFIENSALDDIYQAHDLLILPSKSETWGLVIEEALYRGLPVLASDRVGCAPEMIDATGAGLTFILDDIEDFNEKYSLIEQNYANFAKRAAAIDFDARASAQVNAWIKIISAI